MKIPNIFSLSRGSFDYTGHTENCPHQFTFPFFIDYTRNPGLVGIQVGMLIILLVINWHTNKGKPENISRKLINS